MFSIGALWPVLLGGALGVVVGVLAGFRRGVGSSSRLTFARTATIVTTASVGALVATWWLWLAERRPFPHLYVPPAEGTQFLSNEQFTTVVTLGRLAWTLTFIMVMAGTITVWAWSRGDGRRERHVG